jgi:ribosomal protein L7/L12
MTLEKLTVVELAQRSDAEVLALVSAYRVLAKMQVPDYTKVVHPDVRAAALHGKIHAIKRQRELTNCCLTDAKEFVEANFARWASRHV